MPLFPGSVGQPDMRKVWSPACLSVVSHLEMEESKEWQAQNGHPRS